MKPRIKTDTYLGLTDPRLALMDQQTRRLFFRGKLWERDDGQCGICGEQVEYHEMDVDHIRSRAMGGTDHWDNLRPAHAPCNRRRGRRDIYPGRPRKRPPAP